MDLPKDKASVLDEMRREHAAMEELLTNLDSEQMLAPALESGWSVKDVLAHIVSWERLMLGWVEATVRGETPVVYAPGYSIEEDETGDVTDRFNARLYDENKSRPLEEVLTDLRSTHEQARSVIGSLSQEQLLDPNHFAWRKGRPLVMMVGGNTFWHYREHIDDIKARLETS